MREKNAKLLCSSAIIFALSISGCTTSSSSLLEGVAKDASLVQSNTAEPPENGASLPTTEQSTAPAPASTTAATATTKADNVPAQIIATDNAATATNQVIQTAQTAVPVEQPSTLSALFGSRSKPTAALASSPAENITAESQPNQPANALTPQPDTKAGVTPPALPTPPALDRTSQSAGAAARLFSSGKNTTRGQASGTQQPAIIAALPHKSTSEYNFTLPGVRANGGVEIHHRNKVFDESDIDLDEDDYSAPVTLASVGGMARLAPNGLRTQHDKVQVSCLKPQLVSMIKRLETHYRKPVVITSGYRSPSHNRNVSGAKRSFHMSCSAADLQIPGVSKWEIARHVRTWPGRGGVGTYCHTESVHIDVGPERDWNWRCRRG